MSDQTQRTNTHTADPVSDRYRQCLFDWLVAHAPLWNQINYRRRQQYFDEDGDVWDADYTELYEQYVPLLGKATGQQVARKNSEGWRSHFRRDQYVRCTGGKRRLPRGRSEIKDFRDERGTKSHEPANGANAVSR